MPNFFSQKKSSHKKHDPIVDHVADHVIQDYYREKLERRLNRLPPQERIFVAKMMRLNCNATNKIWKVFKNYQKLSYSSDETEVIFREVNKLLPTTKKEFIQQYDQTIDQIIKQLEISATQLASYTTNHPKPKATITQEMAENVNEKKQEENLFSIIANFLVLACTSIQNAVLFIHLAPNPNTKKETSNCSPPPNSTRNTFSI